jgi:protein TonB
MRAALPAQPNLPVRPGLPQLASPAAPALPQIDMATAHPVTKRSVTPATRPKARPARAAATLQPAKQASGSSTQTHSGQNTQRAVTSENAAATRALKAAWGADIHAKIQRNMRYPAGLRSTGTAKLALQVARTGQLEAIELTRSSGTSLLDEAALRAVKRAGRFVEAPEGLTGAIHGFSLSLSFKR